MNNHFYDIALNNLVMKECTMKECIIYRTKTSTLFAGTNYIYPVEPTL